MPLTTSAPGRQGFPAKSDPAKTLFEKVWESRLVRPETPDLPALLYVDLHLVHEVTSPQAFATLRQRGLSVRRPDRTVATMDHAVPTLPPGTDGAAAFVDSQAARQTAQLARNCQEFGVELFPIGDPNQGIVHVIGPELGLTQPGRVIVCGDSHTSTHGAFGALAFGIGATEVGHVLASQCLLQRKPKTMAVDVEGALDDGVSAKDLALALIAKIGVGGGTGCVLEYRGAAVRGLSMEGRMTLCNMSIEAGARAGMIAPDETTYAYLAGRDRAPRGAEWDRALTRWRALASDEDAAFDRRVSLDAGSVEPMVTYGVHPGMAAPITGAVPQPANPSEREALAYMSLEPGRPLQGVEVDVVFIGSCTNGRLSDLRDAAAVLAGRKIAPSVRALVTPGSRRVKQAAEREGLRAVFESAGAEWREPGCSMCIAMNGDRLEPGQTAISTSNRNFQGRQGPGGRTILASPATAAASAVTGAVADPRRFRGGRS